MEMKLGGFCRFQLFPANPSYYFDRAVGWISRKTLQDLVPLEDIHFYLYKPMVSYNWTLNNAKIDGFNRNPLT